MASNLFKVTELSSNGKEVWNPQEGTRGRAAAAAKSLPSCLTLCDPIDSSPPGSSIPGILQARTLEWVAISFSGGKGRETESVNSTHHSVMNYMEKNLKRFTKPHERGSIWTSEQNKAIRSRPRRGFWRRKPLFFLPHASLPPALWEVGGNEVGGGQGRR